MAFLDSNYLLTNNTARELYGAVAELPIIDAHNHADVRAIAENRSFANIWEAEAATDHYVWELMRKRGVAETLITGDATPEDKWHALARVFPGFVGNPSYEWIHLDLKRQLGIDQLINEQNAGTIWDRALELLKTPAMTPRSLLKSMKVECMCSTDDPIDSLEYHRALNDDGATGLVRPTFRPDKAMNIFKPDWRKYIEAVEKRVDGKFKTIADLVAALEQMHDYFADNGCVASDHGVEVPYAYQVDEDDANKVFKKVFTGGKPDEDDIIVFMSYMLNEFARMDAEKDWVFQVHIGAVRDVRTWLSEDLGPDTGGDISDHLLDIVAPLSPLLNRFDDQLKVVLYTLDPHHQSTVATLCRAFGQKVNLGAAWWLNDSPVGMKRQLEYIGSVDLLANFAGMVTDSRKLLSYGSRTEMFRRVLCDVVGGMVERGQVPHSLAETLTVDLCYERPKTLFGLA